MAWDRVRASNTSLKARLAESKAARGGRGTPVPADHDFQAGPVYHETEWPARHDVSETVMDQDAEPSPADELWEIVDPAEIDLPDAPDAPSSVADRAAFPLPTVTAGEAIPSPVIPATAQAAPDDGEGREKRRAPRRVHALAAQFHVAPGSAGIPCMVADMSATGARIKLLPGQSMSCSTADLPARITLYLRLDRTQVDCEVVRRGEDSFGVRFLSAPTAVTAPAKRTSALQRKPPKKKGWL